MSTYGVLVNQPSLTRSLNINRHIDNNWLEHLSELLFILASVDRLALLSDLTIEKSRLSQLSTKLSATPQETSKHLTRLRDAKLVEKDSDGLFGLTPFGKIIVNLLPSIKFITQNRDYFLSHDISSLPLEFIERLGELQESQYGEKVGSILAHTQQVVRDAEQFIWLMADILLVVSNTSLKAESLRAPAQ